jgi:hypothetical protein
VGVAQPGGAVLPALVGRKGKLVSIPILAEYTAARPNFRTDFLCE